MVNKKKPDPTKIANTNPLMIAFKKDRNTPESLEKLRNDAALKSINKGRSNRGQKSLDKLPPAMQKKSDKRLADAKGGKKPRVIPENKPKTNTDTEPTGAAKYDGLIRSQYLAKLKKQRTSEVDETFDYEEAKRRQRLLMSTLMFNPNPLYNIHGKAIN